MKDENQKIKLSKEHGDHKWITEVGEAEMMVMPDQKKTLEKVLNSDRPITDEPENTFTPDEKLEEYLTHIHEQKSKPFIPPSAFISLFCHKYKNIEHHSMEQVVNILKKGSNNDNS